MTVKTLIYQSTKTCQFAWILIALERLNVLSWPERLKTRICESFKTNQLLIQFQVH